jgi:hypothetical protein
MNDFPGPFGYPYIEEFSYRVVACEKLAHEQPQFYQQHKQTKKSYPDVGRLMFFAKFKLGKDYRAESSEVRLLKAWCDYFKSYDTPFVTVRISPKEVYILKERNAGEEEKQR